ncbi:MAG: hypothetical protein B7C24_12415 [Bacteroidetes bacterium 4572_77]|nr:MAG: hypothetical protein B7C24_12415 [Bacteroidetes bacterium 4572_77]
MAKNREQSFDTKSDQLEVIEFVINSKDREDNVIQQSYGINVMKVREIILMPKLTVLPNIPPNIIGIFNIRGSIIPAVDLQKALFGEDNIDEKRKMIIAEFNNVTIGFVVSDVEKIHRIFWNDIKSVKTLDSFSGEHSSSILGFIQMGDKQLQMLDIEKIVADIDPTAVLGEVNKDIVFHKRMKIVTVDDSAVVRSLLQTRLKDKNSEINSFRTAEDVYNYALDIVEKVKLGAQLTDLIDIIISDIEMPGMDGYTLITKLRSIPELANLPIIIFSSLVNAEAMKKGKEAGATAQVSKQQVGELLKLIKELCDS